MLEIPLKHISDNWGKYLSITVFIIPILFGFGHVLYGNYLSEKSPSTIIQNQANEITIKNDVIKNENPVLSSAIEEKISLLVQDEKTKLIVDKSKSTNSYSVSYHTKKPEKGEFCIVVQNNLDYSFGGIGADKYLKIKVKEGMAMVDGYDLRKGDYVKKINEHIKGEGGFSQPICFSLDTLYRDDNMMYPSNIKLELVYNDNISLNSGHEIVLMKSNVALVNTSGKEGLSTNYYNKIKETKNGFYGVQRVNNYNAEKEFLKSGKVGKNTILFTEERYKDLATDFNRDIMENKSDVKQVTLEECQSYIIDNRIELKKRRVEIEESPYFEYIAVEYLFNGGFESSDYSLCKKANLLLILLDI